MSSLRPSSSDDEFAARLLRAARSESPSKEGKERATAAALLLGLGGGPSLGGGLGAKKLISNWVWIGLSVAILMGASIVMYFARSTARVPAPETTAALNPPSAAVSLAPAPSTPTDDAMSSLAPVLREAPTTQATVSRPSSPPSIQAPAVSARSPGESKPVEGPSELSLLRATKVELEANRSGGALAILDRYAQLFPHPNLGEEAEALRVEALVEAHQTGPARAAASRFFQRHPASPYGERVDALIGRLAE